MQVKAMTRDMQFTIFNFIEKLLALISKLLPSRTSFWIAVLLIKLIFEPALSSLLIWVMGWIIDSLASRCSRLLLSIIEAESTLMLGLEKPLWLSSLRWKSWLAKVPSESTSVCKASESSRVIIVTVGKSHMGSSAGGKIAVILKDGAYCFSWIEVS